MQTCRASLFVLQRLESQNEVEFALLQSVHQFLHGAVLDVELYMRIGVEKGDERLGHDVAEGERYADVQFACKHFLQIVHVVYTGFGRIDRVLGVRSQFLARFCEVNLMRIALEERQTYLLFQMRNLL